jgi:hypothetical protein
MAYRYTTESCPPSAARRRSWYPLCLMKNALIPERKQPPDSRDRSAWQGMHCKRWGSTPKKCHLVSPLLTNAGRRRRGRTHGACLSKYRVGCGGQPRAAPWSHRHAPQSQCRGLEGGPIATTTAGAACFFPACYPSPAGNGDDEE